MSDPKDDVPVIPRKSLLEQLNIPLGVKIALLVLGALCAVPPTLLGAGIAVPPALVAVASALAAILASLGVASGGLEKPKE